MPLIQYWSVKDKAHALTTRDNELSSGKLLIARLYSSLVIGIERSFHHSLRANKLLLVEPDDWDKEVVTSNWIELTLRLNKEITDLSPTIGLCSLQKDVYSRGLANVYIGTDNPFLSVEEWKFDN